METGDVVCMEAETELEVAQEVGVKTRFVSPIGGLSKFGLDAEINVNNPNFKVAAYKEKTTFGMAASYAFFDNKYDINLAIESPEETWGDINLSGHIDIHREMKVLEIFSIGTNSQNKLNLEAEIGENQGRFKMDCNLPIIQIMKKEVFLQYKLNEGFAEIQANFGGDTFEFKLEQDGKSYRMSANTPFNGFEKISSRLTFTDATDKASIDLFLDINEKVTTIKGHYSHLSYDLLLDLKTPHEKIQKLKIAATYTGKLFEAAFAVNDVIYQTHFFA